MLNFNPVVPVRVRELNLLPFNLLPTNFAFCLGPYSIILEVACETLTQGKSGIMLYAAI
jgi:hypothetical protein